MKNAVAIVGGFIFISVILFSCTANLDDKKGENPVVETSKTKTESSKDHSTSEVDTTSSSSNLPLVKTKSTGEKYVDWGTKPVETEDGPADSWTMPFMMCQGPPFMDGQLKASSTLAPQGKSKYSASNVCDDDPTTAWVEGKSDYGVGEFLELEWKPMSDGEISILNGYQASQAVWEDNSRVRTMKVSVGGKDVCIIELADVMGVQKFNISGLVNTTEKGHEYNMDGSIRFTITEVYPGLKHKDTAISGIFSCGG